MLSSRYLRLRRQGGGETALDEDARSDLRVFCCPALRMAGGRHVSGIFALLQRLAIDIFASLITIWHTITPVLCYVPPRCEMVWLFR